jgi:hypothetical protein
MGQMSNSASGYFRLCLRCGRQFHFDLDDISTLPADWPVDCDYEVIHLQERAGWLAQEPSGMGMCECSRPIPSGPLLGNEVAVFKTVPGETKYQDLADSVLRKALREPCPEKSSFTIYRVAHATRDGKIVRAIIRGVFTPMHIHETED